MKNKHSLRLASVYALTLASAWPAFAQSASNAQDCRDIDDDRARLACFDQASGRAAKPAAVVNSAPVLAPAPVTAPVLSAPTDRPSSSLASHRQRSMLERWDMTDDLRPHDFIPRTHKPVYVLPLSVTNRINEAPFSEQARVGAGVDTNQESAHLQSAESKFQLSLKTRVWHGLIASHGDLWFGYTQSSRWQVYNGAMSRPFRETNYEPEAIFAFKTPYEIFGWKGRMSNLSLTHQSNGRADPLSRSWNRVIAEFGLEKGDWTLQIRPWWRIPESAATDDNPAISDYIGRGEVLLSYGAGGKVLTLQARHSLRGGAKSRGSLQLEWAYPLAGQLFGYVQLFSGYGDSLIDYNFRQTRLGLGVSLVEWL
ncbi:phospholipase [Paucibacter sp. KBW04]|uniref:phospholipase A n=1 Tax=Paucibacter sp. KBW04 TaxID=2153361 RepID=UPI000F588786|nr:phospholipase A [Paucibacter sp. KBW04]RQO58601.1 phospholipase [Paucibacter sp. KBW04]